MKLKIVKEEYINKTFRLNEKLVREVEKICEIKGISMNKFVDICIRYSIENLDTEI
jgi:predicted HicB family RNase H-like nuclease